MLIGHNFQRATCWLAKRSIGDAVYGKIFFQIPIFFPSSLSLAFCSLFFFSSHSLSLATRKHGRQTKPWIRRQTERTNGIVGKAKRMKMDMGPNSFWVWTVEPPLLSVFVCRCFRSPTPTTFLILFPFSLVLLPVAPIKIALEVSYSSFLYIAV